MNYKLSLIFLMSYYALPLHLSAGETSPRDTFIENKSTKKNKKPIRTKKDLYKACIKGKVKKVRAFFENTSETDHEYVSSWNNPVTGLNIINATIYANISQKKKYTLIRLLVRHGIDPSSVQSLGTQRESFKEIETLFEKIETDCTRTQKPNTARRLKKLRNSLSLESTNDIFAPYKTKGMFDDPTGLYGKA